MLHGLEHALFFVRGVIGFAVYGVYAAVRDLIKKFSGGSDDSDSEG